jgi:hypothetical protein
MKILKKEVASFFGRVYWFAPFGAQASTRCRPVRSHSEAIFPGRSKIEIFSSPEEVTLSRRAV